MRSSGTAYFLPIVFALLLVPSASGSPQAEAAGPQPASGAPFTTLPKASLPLVLLEVAASGRKGPERTIETNAPLETNLEERKF